MTFAEVCQVAISGNKDASSQLEKKLGREELSKLLAASTCDGFTPFHFAVRYNTSSVIGHFSEILGDAAYKVAKKATNQGHLPIALANQNPIFNSNIKENIKIFTILREYTFTHEIKPIKEKINLCEVLNRYPEVSVHSQLHINLVSAVIAANMTREMIDYTSTHVMTNTFPPDDFVTVNEKVISARREFKRHWYDRFRKHASSKKEASYALKNHAGNCSEYSHLTLKNLYELKVNAPIEVFRCAREGNIHIFNVIGRNRFSIANNYNTWGDEVVVSDSQNGLVFLGKEIPKYLNSWVTFHNAQGDCRGCVNIPYQPAFHKLKSDLRIEKPFSLFGFFRKQKTEPEHVTKIVAHTQP